MGMFSFIKEAGEKLFGIGEAKAAEEVAKKAPTPVNVDAANKAAADAIAAYVAKMNLTAQDLTIGFDGASGTVIVQGMADTQETKEKILLCCGNVKGGACARSIRRDRNRSRAAILYGCEWRYFIKSG